MRIFNSKFPWGHSPALLIIRPLRGGGEEKSQNSLDSEILRMGWNGVFCCEKF